MSHIPDLLQQVKESTRHAHNDSEKGGDRANNTHTGHVRTKISGDDEALWRGATEALIEPAHALITAVNDGLEHAGLQLGIIHKHRERGDKSGHKDEESQGGMIQPGDPKFSTYLEEKLNEFSHGRLQSLSAWTMDNRISEEKESHTRNSAGHNFGETETPRDHQQLNLVLYIHQMVSETARK